MRHLFQHAAPRLPASRMTNPPASRFPRLHASHHGGNRVRISGISVRVGIGIGIGISFISAYHPNFGGVDARRQSPHHAIHEHPTGVFISPVHLASCPLSQSMEICKSLHTFVPCFSDPVLTRRLCSTRGARPPTPAAADRGRPPPRGAERGHGGQRGGEEGGRRGEEAVRLGGERRGLPPRARGGREGLRYLNSSIFLCFFFRRNSSCLNTECDFCVWCG